MKKILVTGGTGLVGAHLLLYLLEKDQPVTAVYRKKSSLGKTENLFKSYGKEHLFARIRWVEADITDALALSDIVKESDVIFHAAAKVSFLARDKKEMFHTNVNGTEMLVNLALEHGVSYFLHVSSVAALGGNELVKSEKSVWSWSISHTPYGASKFLAEMEVWRGFQEGLQGAVINPSVIIGPGFWNSGFGNVVSRMARGKMPFYVTAKTGFVDVDDVVRIMWKLYEKKVVHQRFVVNAENRKFDEILFRLAELLKVNPPRYKLTEGFANWIRLLTIPLTVWPGKGKLWDKAALNALFEDTEYDNAQIVNLLDYRFIPVEKSLQKLVQHYLRHTS